jgi:4-hydroxybenzoate polyprenyltransferase
MKEGKLKEYAKLARIEYSGFSCVIVIGALSVKGSALNISDAILLFFLNVLTLIWGFIHNDYCDFEYDRIPEELSERPLVKGTVSRRSALVIVMICLLINLTIPLFFVKTILLAIVLVFSIIFAALYNILSKKIVGSDAFYAGSATLLVLFGALAVSGGQGLRGLGELTLIILAIEFIDHFFFNAVEGGLKDVENDQKAGAKTIATYLVVSNGKKMAVTRSFRAIFIFLKVATIILVFIPFLFLDLRYYLWQVVLLFILALGAMIFTIKILNIDSFDREKIGSYSLKQELACKFLVPIMLIGFIGVPWTLFLLFVPLIWFHFFNYVLHGQRLTLPKGF